MAEAIISTAQGIAKGVAKGYPAAIPLVAAAVATGFAQIETIRSQQFADGGLVSGPGGPRDDLINARLSNGEFIVNARATAANRGLLEAINSGRRANTSSSGNRSFSTTETGGGGGANVSIVINNEASGTKVEIETNPDGTEIEVFIRSVSERLASDFNNGAGPLTKAIKDSQKRNF